MGCCHSSGCKTMTSLDFIPQNGKKVIERGKSRKLSKKDPIPHLKSMLFWETSLMSSGSRSFSGSINYSRLQPLSFFPDVCSTLLTTGASTNGKNLDNLTCSEMWTQTSFLQGCQTEYGSGCKKIMLRLQECKCGLMWENLLICVSFSNTKWEKLYEFLHRSKNIYQAPNCS